MPTFARLTLPALCALAMLLFAACGGGSGTGAAAVQGVPPSGSGPQALSTPVWYVIADAGGGGGGDDRLYSVDITLAPPANAQTAIGAGTGTNNIEGAAFWPGTDTLYAFNSDRLGTIDLTTGVWTQVVNKDVWDDGIAANIVGLDKNRNPENLSPNVLSDIDSVSFDPNTGVAYGVARVSGADILFIFSEVTGRIIRGAFNIGGTTYDYFRVPPVESGNEDLDDIAIDPYDGQLYGIANGGGLADRLVRVDKFTGVATDVGALGVDDMEGFAFYNDATMWGVTGSASNNAGDGSSNDNSVFSINRVTGQAFDRRPLTAGGSDFESMAFLTADLNEFCGRVWCDDNGNGTQDGGEIGVANVTLVLWRDFDNNDVVDAGTDVALVSTTTDAAGDYCFGVASTGDYVITVKTDTLPANFILAQADVQAVSVVGFGNTVNGLDFIKVGAVGTLGDTVFSDEDADGVQDITEPGLRDVTVNLYGPGPDGTCGTPDDVFLATTTTDGGGYYFFQSLVDGSYCVDVDESTLPPASTLTTANEPHAATITAGSNDLLGDFGYQFPGRIGDLVWLDVDGDGAFDPGEPGLAGIDVTLTGPGPDGFLGTADDVAVAATTTGADGTYQFMGLAPGSYAVTADATDTPSGTTLTTFANPLRVTLRQGQDFVDADFGFVGSGTIGDRVWDDVDGDGVQDGGEPGISGVTVNLTEAGPDGTLGTADDLSFPPQVTGATGLYTFPGLPGGTYHVDVDESTLPLGLRTRTSGDSPTLVTLATGGNHTTADFGFKTDDASIGDRIWNDLDGDGTDDPGEPGLVGVTVNLTEAGPDGTLGTADDIAAGTTATGALGAYDFTALPAGTYRVDVDESSLAAGLQLSTGNEPLDVTLAASQDYNTADFGYWVSAAIGDRLWNDLNGDGVQDAGEPGLNGVTVVLTEAGPDGALGTADDVAAGTTATAGDGDYAFTGLPPGLYRIDVSDATLPAGFVTSTGNDPLDETITAGEDFTDADFGYWSPSTIGDLVWNDVNGDGVRDGGEPGLLGVTVDLTEAGPDGTFGTADDVLFPSETTAADGSYDFTNLPAGLYRVDVDDTTLPSGFGPTTGNDPLDVTLSAGEDYNGADFGYWESATLGDRVWEDLDGDGVQDAGEPGLVGVTVVLTGAGPDATLGTADDIAFPSVMTGLDGAYTFTGLAPDLYEVDVLDASVPVGMAATTTDPLNVVLGPGDAVDTADVGFRHTGRIGDLVWDDLDGDGVRDAGEPGLDGVTVLLASAGPDGLCGTADDGATISSATAGGGLYVFEGLAPGTWCAMIDGASVPPGYVPTAGGPVTTVPLTPGQDFTDADFGFQLVGSVGDRVWQDVNENGAQDPTEPGLVGVTVNMTGAGPDGTLGTADDVAYPPQVTGAGGSYMFTGVPAGLYRVDVDGATAPSGMQLTTANDPLDVTLTAGQGYALADFGFQHAGSIGDRIWQDVDEDMAQDAGEPGLVGVTVDLVGAGVDAVFGTADDVVFPSEVTGVNGAYSFDRLPPGSYRMTVDPASVPPGMQLTTGNQPLTIVLAPAETVTTADVGYQYAGSIGNRIWEDRDGDAFEDAGEPGVAGVAAELVEAGPDTTFGTADDVVFSDEITALDGSYLFDNLPPGVYRVTVDGATVPAGLVLTTGNLPFDVTLGPAASETDADFGYRHTGRIGDRVWNDLDGDGVQEGGEAGLNGVTVNLTGAGPDGTLGTADDVAYPPLLTVTDGDYEFTDLPPGLYEVDVDTATAPMGMVLTTGNDPSNVALGAGVTVDTVDFGLRFASSIGDRVWQDLDFDGLQEAGEPGLNGVTVNLVEAGPDGTLGTADDVSFPPAVTSGDGDYLFSNLAPGDYRVRVDGSTVPAGFLLSTANEPFDVTLGATQMVTTADFGYQALGTLGDRVWEDLDGDGLQDAGEPGLDGVTVTLLGAGPDDMFGTADDVTFPPQVTTGGGAYDFTDLTPGTYRADVDQGTAPAGAVLTTGNDPFDVVIGTGGDVDTADFGFQRRGSVGDRVWDDQDGDGVQDAGEPGLDGVTVTLTGAGPDGTLGTADDVAFPPQVTAGGGLYDFTGLPADLYRVDVDQGTAPAGAALTTGNDPLDQALTAGGDVDTADFGFQLTGTIGDRVWSDTDMDGVQDAGETGLNGVTLTLTEAGPDGVLGTADDVAAGSQVTAGDGDYTFPSLTPGLYRVDVVEATLPANVTLTGGVEPFDVTLVAGQTVTDADFGYALVLFEVGDVIWVDSDADGIYEPTMGEAPVPGVTVTLKDDGGNVIGTDTTNGAGEYRFNVPPGSYTVEVDATNFQTGGPLEGLTTTGAGTDVSAVITADNFDLDFGFLGAGSGNRQFCTWWAQNTAQWPLQSLTVGGTSYSQAETLAILSRGNLLRASLYGRSAARAVAQADMSVLVAWAIIGAKLNTGAGNPSATIDQAVRDADAWLLGVGFDSGIRPGHPSYAAGQRLYNTLSTWNMGQ